MHAKWYRLDFARELFEEMRMKNEVTYECDCCIFFFNLWHALKFKLKIKL